MIRLHRALVTNLRGSDPVRIFKLKVDEDVAISVPKEMFSQFHVPGVFVEQHCQFRFEAGQWVDFMVPDVPAVGGFSICSTFEEFQRTKEFELAVKKSRDPISRYVFSEDFKQGSLVAVRTGGAFLYKPHPSLPVQVKQDVFIAGGIGINPLMSMIRKLLIEDNVLFPVMLLYSVKSIEKAIFLRELLDLSQKHSNFSPKLFVTSASQSQSLDMDTFQGRIKPSVLAQLFGQQEKSRSSFYICGPPAMMEELSPALTEDSQQMSDQVHFEKWW